MLFKVMPKQYVIRLKAQCARRFARRARLAPPFQHSVSRTRANYRPEPGTSSRDGLLTRYLPTAHIEKNVSLNQPHIPAFPRLFVQPLHVYLVGPHPFVHPCSHHERPLNTVIGNHSPTSSFCFLTFVCLYFSVNCRQLFFLLVRLLFLSF